MTVSQKINITIYAIVNSYTCSLPDDEKQYIQEHDDIIDKILNCNENNFDIEKIELDKSIPSEIFAAKSPIDRKTILKFSSVYQLENNYDPLGKEGLYGGVLKLFYVGTVYRNVIDLITCCNIVRPGVLGLMSCYVYIDNKFNTLINMVDSFNIVQFLSRSLDAQLFSNNFNFKDVFVWLKAIGKDEKGLSINGLGRAVGSLNQIIYSEENYITATIWVISALEALFCRNYGPLGPSPTEQIIVRSSQMFPNLKGKKIYKEMYRYRSKFSHGCLNIPIYPFLNSMMFDYSYDLIKNIIDEQVNLTVSLNVLFKTLQDLFCSSSVSLDVSWLQSIPNCVPGTIQDDYKRVSKILKFSPSASAIFSRRCIRSIIRISWKIERNTLNEEIDALLEVNTDDDLINKVCEIRRINNISEIMDKDVNMMIDIHTNEARLLKDFVHFFIEFTYNENHKHEVPHKNLEAI